jgi:hypothetical protein
MVAGELEAMLLLLLRLRLRGWGLWWPGLLQW